MGEGDFLAIAAAYFWTATGGENRGLPRLLRMIERLREMGEGYATKGGQKKNG